MANKRQFNQGQLDVLKVLYKFRFGNRELIAAGLNRQNTNAIYSKLQLLERQGYIGRHYEPSYRLAGRAAEYYMLPQGLRALRVRIELNGLDDTLIKSSYKDKTASNQFISRCLHIFAVHNRLTNVYDNLQFFTKRELTGYDYFPEQLPDGFISHQASGDRRRYFVELFTTDVPSFAVDRRLRQFIAYYEDDDWAVTETPFPPILCICENGRVEKRLAKQIARAINRSDSDVPLYTTTLPAILGSDKGADAIWSAVDEHDELLSLTDMP